ncbi:hypothetical protein [Algoriphagus sp. oki45]|uniref:hypothetical protein n=1 Tax=Algoriphagus sp. oki45 TaxID=3067294 RepID=UPI0030C65A9D
MKKDYPNKMAVIDSIGNTLADFTPNGLDINKIMIKNGELWIPENLNTNLNESQLKIYKLKINLN